MKLFSTLKLAATAMLLTLATAATAQNLQRATTARLRFQRTAPQKGMVSTARQQTLPAIAKAPRRAAVVPATLFASVIYNTNLDARPIGAYELTLGGEKILWELQTDSIIASMGAVLKGYTYYVSYQTLVDGFVYDWLDTYDIRTWARTSHRESNVTLQASGDIAADPVTGDIYGCFYTADGSNCFAKVDFDEMTATPILPLYSPWIGCAFDTDGTLYCVDGDGAFCRVDTKTGQTTAINYYTGITSFYPSSATIDPDTHIMYCSAAPMDGRGLLYAIDITTGEATLVEELPNSEELVGLAIPVPFDEAAPAAVAGLNLDFADGALTGQAIFTAPSLTAGGEAGTGALSYTLAVDGTQVAQSSMNWGEIVTVPLTIAAPGIHTISVTPQAGDHQGHSASLTQYIGNDTPQAPVVSIKHEGEGNVISWTLPEAGVNGGYVNPAATTYTVTRTTDGTILALGLTSPTYTDAVAEGDSLTAYTYTVTATFDGRTSEAATTDALYIGHITPPYLQTFDDESSLNGWTVNDHNDDTMTWMWKSMDGGVVRVNYRNKYVMDDYLFTPALRLEGGKAYRLTFDVNSHTADYTERIEVFGATAPTPEAITDTLVGPTDIHYTADYQTMTAVVTPAATGNYYVAFHGISDPGQYYLKLDNVALSEPLPTTLPAAPADFTVTPDYDGQLRAHIALTAPATDIAGQPLAELTRIDVRRGTTLVATIDQPQGLIELDDTTVATAGRYTYTATAYNTQGEGLSATALVYVGVNKPAAVSNLKMEETSEGIVTLTWDAPALDADGQPLNPALVTYVVANVTTGTPEVVAEGLTACTATLQPTLPGGQDFMSYAVFAVTAGGMSDGIATPAMPIGTPYALPFAEGFPYGSLQHGLALGWNDPSHKAEWVLLTDDDLADLNVVAPDMDGGMIGMKGNLDDEATIWTGKIDLREAANPELSFQTYKIMQEETPDWNFFNVEVICDGKKETIEEGLCVSDIFGEDNDWVTAYIPLQRYKGKVIQVGLTACVQMYMWTFIDDLRVEDAGNAIQNVNIQKAADGVVYDLAGRRVAKPTHGVFITSGRKIATK